MTESPLVEPLPSGVADAAADLGTYRFAVTLESGAHFPGALLAVAAPVVALTPILNLIDVVLLGEARYPAVAWIVMLLVAAVFAAAAAVLLRRRAPVLYCFDAGAVRFRGRTADARSWTTAPPYEWPGHLELRTAGRRFASIPDADAERVAALAAEHETARARALIATGTPVTYGTVTLAPDALLLDGVPAPWPGVREPIRGEETLSLFASSREPVRLPRRAVPHERTLLTLIREHRGF